MESIKTVLVVDDDPYWARQIRDELRDAGVNTLTATSVTMAKQIVAQNPPDLAVVDLMMSPGEGEDWFEAKAGFESGLVLSRWLREKHPDVRILGVSSRPDGADWFQTYGEGFVSKTEATRRTMVCRILGALGVSRPARGPRVFIVHGHDDAAKLELKNYLQNALRFPEPVILHEKPNSGRSIIEKLEGESADVDVVFVLLTPDDLCADGPDPNDAKRHARQNVILELGYFLGRLGRTGGHVVLLHKGPLELPSDIVGLVYVDISQGVEAAGEAIRREVQEWL